MADKLASSSSCKTFVTAGATEFAFILAVTSKNLKAINTLQMAYLFWHRPIDLGSAKLKEVQMWKVTQFRCFGK